MSLTQGSLCWHCRLRRFYTLREPLLASVWNYASLQQMLATLPGLSSLNAIIVIIKIPPAPCKILGRWWSLINTRWVNKLYQQILNEWELGRREITLRSSLIPRTLLAMRRVICPSETSDPLPGQYVLCRLQEGTIPWTIKVRWGNNYTHI